jgi:dynein heavy chain
MNRRKKGCFGPPPGQQFIIFVDDLNMPRREKWGAQPPIELLRQWMDYGGWYDIFGEKEFKFIQDVKFCAAMGPPGISGNPITNRYVRHYNILYIEPYSAASQQQIFSQVMDWMFARESKTPWAQGVKGLKDSVVQATILTYAEIQSRFKPTPAKSHYTYNLRDVSKVFQGISKSDPRALVKDDDIVKLWSHECQRVFADRLISQQDRDDFMAMLKTKVKERFKKDYEKIVEVKPLLFASFVPTLYREDDVEKKKPIGDIYCELTNRPAMQKKTELSLEEFNTVNRQKKMDLVLFTDAIEHIVKIHRVITTQYGNALLVGVGGSGRKSLTELANFIAGYEIVTLEMAKGYDMNAWREDMAQKLFLACGCERDLKPLVFLFSDTQIIYESFLEDINNILNNGKIPNLYTKEDETTILDSLKEAYKGDPDFKEIQDDQAKVFEVFER